MRDVAADEYRLQPMRFVAPPLVLTAYAIRPDVRDQHRRSFPDERRPSIGPGEAEHADQAHMLLVSRQHLQIVDQVACGRVAAPLAPSVVGADLVVPLE